ncbi:MAG: biotin/lipoyl-binding protein, partial [Firmicutes bacterium]|nr:biotin/lipoyl-binding protein [Bacillota bacterium]
MKQYFKRGITLIIVLSIIFTGCGLFPEEEEFPTVPIVESYEKKEYKQTVVVRGDLVLTESIRCRYTPVQTETLSFQLDDMYIESVYVTEGDIVEVGDLLAQLRIDDLEKQVQEQNYQILLLNMQIEHLYEDWELEAIDEDGRLTAIEKELAQVRELIWLLDVWLQQGEKPEAVNGKSWYVEEEPTQLSMEELKSIESQLKAERDARLDEIELTQDYEKRLRDLHNALLVAEMKLDELEEALEKRRIYAGINGTIVYASNTAVSGSKSIEKELV